MGLHHFKKMSKSFFLNLNFQKEQSFSKIRGAPKRPKGSVIDKRGVSCGEKRSKGLFLQGDPRELLSASHAGT